jgi:CYTH domain-containing protein
MDKKTGSESQKGGEVVERPEIERKFVVHAVPYDLDLESYPSSRIVQGYLSITPDRSERIRKKGNKYFRAIKEKSDNPIIRPEKEWEITKEEFDENWPMTEGKRVEKTRYKIPYGSEMIELDVFDDGNMMAEVEFETLGDAEVFLYAQPEWFGPEVSDDPRFYNTDCCPRFPQGRLITQRSQS